MKKLLLILLCLPMIGFGQEWTFSTLSFPYNLNDVYFINDTVGFAVGDNGVILSSDDGGDNWIVVSSGTTNNLVDILFYNDTVGYICSKDDGNPNNGGNGVGGTLLKTNDGGNTWNIFYIENDDVDYNSIGLILAPNTPYEQIYILGTYIAGGNTDAALIDITVNPLPSASTSILTNHLYINDAYMPAYNTFIAVGYPNLGSSYGSFRRVGGVNMNMTIPYSINFNSLDFIDGTNRCIMVGNAFAFSGSGGVIYEGDNMFDQNNYQLNLNSFTSTYNFNSVDMIGIRGWVVGDGGVIVSTTDGGSAWNSYSNSNFQDLNSVFLLDSCNGWIVGDNGIVSKISCVLGCTDVLACNYNPLATIDDGNCIYTTSTTTVTAFNNYAWNGVTYTESGIYEVSSSPGYIGDYYQGGVIFYLDGNGGGLVSDIGDLCNSYWGCPWSLMNTDSWDGAQNSLDIMLQCADPSIAARLCDNSYNQGYSDWYLPAKGQLNIMYNNKTDIDNESLLNGGGIFITGNNDFYLSSSEYNTTAINNSVWVKKFANGSDGYTGKDDLHNIRAIRSISIIPTSSAGCDSTAILNLTITNPTAPTVNNTSSLLSTSACDSLIWNGNTYFTSGTYSDTTTYSTGCINIDSLVLIINTISNTIEAAGFCSFQTINYNWYGVNYTQIGTYTQSLGTTTNGCDSIGTLNIYNLGQNCGCDSVYYYEGDWMMPGNWQLTTNSGTFYQGLDSSGNAIYVNIIVNYSTSNITTVTSCNSYAWPADGNTYSSSGIYTNTYTSIAGCDSTITLNLTIDSSNTIVTTTACDSFLIGSNYYIISGAYTDTLTSVNGCDSVVNTNLTIEQNTSSYDTLSVTASIVWNGMPLIVSGDYSTSLINSVGCDSIVNLNLTVTTTGISDIANTKSNLVKITDMLGQETPYRKNTPLFYIYDDGTVEKRIVIE